MTRMIGITVGVALALAANTALAQSNPRYVQFRPSATKGALYTPDSGICVAGPCRGARLAPLEVVEREGKVFCIEEFEE